MDAQKSYQLGARPAWQKHADTYGSTILWIAIHSIDLMLWVSGQEFYGSGFAAIARGIPGGGRDAECDGERVSDGQRRVRDAAYGLSAASYGVGARRRPASRERHARHRGISGEYGRDAGDRRNRRRRWCGICRRQQSVFLDFLQSVYQGTRPALSWPEIVRANEATLAAHAGGRTARVRGDPAGVRRRVEAASRMVQWWRSERWQSGRSHPPRKRAYLNGYREFESPPLRQPPKSHG